MCVYVLFSRTHQTNCVLCSEIYTIAHISSGTYKYNTNICLWPVGAAAVQWCCEQARNVGCIFWVLHMYVGRQGTGQARWWDEHGSGGRITGGVLSNDCCSYTMRCMFCNFELLLTMSVKYNTKYPPSVVQTYLFKNICNTNIFSKCTLCIYTNSLFHSAHIAMNKYI